MHKLINRMKKELFQILPLDGVVKTFSCLRTGKKFPLVAEFAFHTNANW